MGIREKINKSQQISMTAAVCVIVIALSFIIWQMTKGGPSLSAAMTKAFYSDDDGKTWFVDDAQKIVPFDHHGKEAVRVRVFRCNGGEPFVGYLERYSDEIKARILEMAAQHPGDSAPDFSLMPMEVRKPGEKTWVNTLTPNSYMEYKRVTVPVCPGGGASEPALVTPADSGNGASN